MSDCKTSKTKLPIPVSLGLLVTFGFVMGYGMLALFGVHPLMAASIFVSDLMHDAVSALPTRMSGIVIISLGVAGMLITGTSLAKGATE